MNVRGVTLLELVVAIAILTFVLGMSGVALASLRGTHDSEAQRLFAQARAQAIRSGLPVVTTLGHSHDSLVPVLLLPDGRAVGAGVEHLTGVRGARR